MLRIRLSVLILLTLVSLKSAQAGEVGSKAANCGLTAINDTTRHDLKQYLGKVVYVDFWASWCVPCAKSFVFMNKLDHDLKERGLQVIAVNLDEVPEEAKAFLTNHPANFTVTVDEQGKCAKDFQVEAMPSSYLIDRHGIIRHVHLGYREDDAKELRVQVEQLLAEK